MTKNILLMLSSVLLSFTAVAEDQRAWNASLGVGVAFRKNLRVGNTYENMDKSFVVRPIPIIQASYGRVSLGVQGISVLAVGDQLANVSAFIKRDGDRYHGLGMTPRKDSVFVGASAKFANYGFTLSHDINGRSKGYIATANYAKFFPLTETLILRTALSLDWLDDKYAEYYYGVRSHEVTASRREYHLNNYFLPGVAIMPIIQLSERSSIVTVISSKILPKEVSQSPTLKGSRFEFGGILSYSYKL
jgi:outer membrane protein